MVNKAVLTMFALALVLSAGGCSQDTSDSGTPRPALPSDGQTTAFGESSASPSPTAPPSASAPSPTVTPSQDPKPSVGEVRVLITNSEWDASTGITVRGYADTVDSKATCTLTLSKADITRNTTSDALESPTTMSCGELVIDASDLSSGDWSATLTYTSKTASGSSAPVVVTVP